MFGRPAVSVLMTVYNRKRYIGDAIQSVLRSTFQNFELLVVDDRSDDASVETARRIAATDSRVKVLVNDLNLGDYPNRNYAASLASGDLLKYVDSDDLIYPHTLQVMVDAMHEHVDAAFGLAHSAPEDEEPYPWQLSSVVAYQKHFLGRGCLSCGPTGAIIRRTAFEKAGGFNSAWGVLSDTDLWYRMAAIHPVVLLPPALVWWRRHEDQEFSRGDAASVYLQRGYELDIEALQSKDCPLNETDRATAIARRKQHCARRLLSLAIRQRRVGTALGLFHRSSLGLCDLATGVLRYK